MIPDGDRGGDDYTLREPVILRFIEAWRLGQCPLIEDYLRRHPEFNRAKLLRELLHEEINLRTGEPRSHWLDEYLRRFPDDAEVVRGVFRDVTSDSSVCVTGEQILDDFIVERELGEGGMGKVYLLRSQSSGQCFAAKTTILRNEKSRRELMAELRTWVDLPDHPHVAARRFFRTVIDEIVIFSEYVNGGSLDAWIRERKLTRLDQILDVAIQFAWGLHAVHEFGLVHQDVKPGNVLMTTDGVVKVADFGLARTRAAAGEAAGGGWADPLVSAVGMTKKYCSPEQSRRQRLSRSTDIWSWGLSVLTMFQGRAVWEAGPDGPQALEAYLRSGPDDPRLPAMPVELAGVLRKCFCLDPGERWASMALVADELINIYCTVSRYEYPRHSPATPERGGQEPVLLDRWSRNGGLWEDPRGWLIKAFQADGRDEADVEALIPPRTGSRRARAIADLTVYEEARRTYQRLVAGGRNDLVTQFASLCLHKAELHQSVGDIAEALTLHDRAIALYERLESQDGQHCSAEDLAFAYVSKGHLVSSLGDERIGVALFDRAIAFYERLMDQEGRRKLAHVPVSACAFVLAETYVAKAMAVSALGNHEEATALLDRAIDLCERVVFQERQYHWEVRLVGVYAKAASVVSSLGNHEKALNLIEQAIRISEEIITDVVSSSGDHEEAVNLLERAIRIYEAMSTDEEGPRVSERWDLLTGLAQAYGLKADVLNALGDHGSAMGLHDREIALYERIIDRHELRELTDDLARAYVGKAGTAHALGDNRTAVGLFDQTIEIYERLVLQEGQHKLANFLVRTYDNKASVVRTMGDDAAAVALYDRIIAFYERLIDQGGRCDVMDSLVSIYMNKASVVCDLGNHAAAVAQFDRIIVLFERLVNQEGRHDLQSEIAEFMFLRSIFVFNSGDQQRGLTEARGAIAILQAEIERSQRPDLRKFLAFANNILQDVSRKCPLHRFSLAFGFR